MTSARLQEDADLVRFVDEHCTGLTRWEVDFMESAVRRVEAGSELSAKQRARLVQIHEERAS